MEFINERIVPFWKSKKEFYPHFVQRLRHCQYRAEFFLLLVEFHQDSYEKREMIKSIVDSERSGDNKTNVMSTFIATIRR